MKSLNIDDLHYIDGGFTELEILETIVDLLNQHTDSIGKVTSALARSESVDGFENSLKGQNGDLHKYIVETVGG